MIYQYFRYIESLLVQILEFWVRIRRAAFASAPASAKQSCQASATASALPATVIMFKIYWNPGLACNNVACAKNANAI